MKRPSWSNIAAVLFALWWGMTCAGCTYTGPPTPARSPMSCVIVTRVALSDTLVVGVYDPPCVQSADSVFYWRLDVSPRCGLQAFLDAGNRTSTIRTACLQPLNMSPRT